MVCHQSLCHQHDLAYAFTLVQKTMDFQKLFHNDHLEGHHHLGHNNDYYVYHQKGYGRVHCHKGDHIRLHLYHHHILLKGGECTYDYYVRMITSMLSVVSMVTVFFVVFSLYSTLKRASMCHMRDLLGLTYPR